MLSIQGLRRKSNLQMVSNPNLFYSMCIYSIYIFSKSITCLGYVLVPIKANRKILNWPTFAMMVNVFYSLLCGTQPLQGTLNYML